MKSYCHIFAVAAVSLASASFSLSAIAQTVIPQPPEVAAKGHILIDFDTGKVLSEQNADMSLAPASLTKMMTSYVIGTELKNGNITNDVKTSDMCIRQANPSIVSTRISLMAEMLIVSMKSQKRPALNDMWAVGMIKYEVNEAKQNII